MRVAELCPVCASYINAACIVYNGSYLPAIDVSPLDTLDGVLVNINNAYSALTGSGAPTTIPLFKGQLYIDTSSSQLWIGMGTSSVNWAMVGTMITTTTTTTTV